MLLTNKERLVTIMSIIYFKRYLRKSMGIFLSLNLILCMALLTACKKGGEKTDISTIIDTSLITDTNASSFIKADADKVIKSKYFDITIAKDSVVPENIGEMCDIVAEDIMKITGLNLYPNTQFSKKRIVVKIQRDRRASIDEDWQINLNECDSIFWNGTSYTFAHELGHLIQFVNFGSFDRLIDEGYATYIADCYSKESTLATSYHLHRTIADYKVPLNSQKAVEERAVFSENIWTMEYYGIGKRLITYIADTYGKDKLYEMFNALRKKLGPDKVSKDGALLTSVMNQILATDNVYDNFTVWLDKNSLNLNELEPTQDYSDISIFSITPLKYTDVWNYFPENDHFYYFDHVNGKISENLTLDFSSGRDYYKLSEGKELEKISANFYADSNCHLNFYDKDKKCYKTTELSAGNTLKIDEENIYQIKIEGKCSFKLEMNIKEIFPKDLALPDDADVR